MLTFDCTNSESIRHQRPKLTYLSTLLFSIDTSLHLWYRPFVAYGGTFIMMTDWQEFDGGEFLERRVRPRVTLNVDGEIYFGKRAYEELGRPEAVKLYFDVAQSRIGVKAVPPGDKTFKIAFASQSKCMYGHARAATFCKYYGIKPETRIEFQDVKVDPDGMMVLDLKTARRVRR